MYMCVVNAKEILFIATECWQFAIIKRVKLAVHLVNILQRMELMLRLFMENLQNAYMKCNRKVVYNGAQVLWRYGNIV